LTVGDSLVSQKVDWIIRPGALLSGTTATVSFPKNANVRWFGVKFKSTDTLSTSFLTPDWDDPVMKKFIVDQGWPDAGILDKDGSIADIGAKPFETAPQQTEVLIRPTNPVRISSTTTATASFMISENLKNPVIQYVKWIDALLYKEVGAAFGGNAKPLLNDVYVFPLTNFIKTTLKQGFNQISFGVPARTTTNIYAFLEIVVKGVKANNEPVTSNVGFLPYRQLDYGFVVKIYNMDLTKELTEVTVGEPVKLSIKPINVVTGKVLTYQIDTATVSPFY
jgi:hypothetical protein